jgi:hypothetical protein
LLSGAADFGCGIIGTKIFAFGGARQTTSDEDIAGSTLASNKTLAFDCATRTAIDESAVSPARASVRAASCQDKIYIVGGYDTGNAIGGTTETLVSQPSKSIEQYDDVTKLVVSLPDMLYGTSRPAVFATPTKVHVVGGETHNTREGTPIVSQTGATMSLQISTGTWSISPLRSDPFAGLGYAQLN